MAPSPGRPVKGANRVHSLDRITVRLTPTDKARVFALSRLLAKGRDARTVLPAYEVIKMAIESLWNSLAEEQRNEASAIVSRRVNAAARCEPAETPRHLRELWSEIARGNSRGETRFHHFQLGVSLAQMEALEIRGLLERDVAHGGVNYRLTSKGRSLASEVSLN